MQMNKTFAVVFGTAFVISVRSFSVQCKYNLSNDKTPPHSKQSWKLSSAWWGLWWTFSTATNYFWRYFRRGFGHVRPQQTHYFGPLLTTFETAIPARTRADGTSKIWSRRVRDLSGNCYTNASIVCDIRRGELPPTMGSCFIVLNLQSNFLDNQSSMMCFIFTPPTVKLIAS